MSSAIDEVDPVCGRQVDRHVAVAIIRYGDIAYFFDTNECADAFRREPDVYSRAPGDRR